MWLESVTGMLRAKQPRLDLVEQRLNECLRQNPHNADAWLLKLELAQHGEGEGAYAEVEAIFAEALEKAPVPELFQQVVSWLLSRRQRPPRHRRAGAGRRGCSPRRAACTRASPPCSSARVGRNEAIEHLQKAMEIDPMLPDSYGLLGMARRDEGEAALAEAEQLLREAVRLAPGDPVQCSRLVDLLLERARVQPDQASALREEAKGMLEEAIKGDRRAPEACILFATLLRESGGDLERASWLLNQAKKVTDRNHERARRIMIERALIDLAGGDIDGAEQILRQQISRDPGNARAFGALGHVLEAREQFIPAHAEYMRAKERSSQTSLECVFYDQQLQRVQAIIEAQAAGLYTPETPDEPLPEPAEPSTRVLRRRGDDETPGEAASEGPGDNGSPEAAGGIIAAAPVVETPVAEAPPRSRGPRGRLHPRRNRSHRGAPGRDHRAGGCPRS